MGVNCWRCHYCDAAIPIGRMLCDKCLKERESEREETRIQLGDITYSRETVLLGPTGKELMCSGHLGRRAIGCGYMSEELQDQIKEFVLKAELARDARRRGTKSG